MLYPPAKSESGSVSPQIFLFLSQRTVYKGYCMPTRVAKAHNILNLGYEKGFYILYVGALSVGALSSLDKEFQNPI